MQITKSDKELLQIQERLSEIEEKAVNSAFTFQVDDCLEDYFKIMGLDSNVHSLRTILNHRLELETKQLKMNQVKPKSSLLRACIPALISFFISALVYKIIPHGLFGGNYDGIIIICLLIGCLFTTLLFRKQLKVLNREVCYSSSYLMSVMEGFGLVMLSIVFAVALTLGAGAYYFLISYIINL